MQKIEPLEHSQYYHIYNCGINGEPVFREPRNYEHFLRLYEKYIDPVAETFAWCLMGNHFHFLARIKEAEKIGCYVPLNSDRSSDAVRFKTYVQHDLSASVGPDRVSNKINEKTPNISKHFSHLFNAYARYFNTRYKRHGSLFERPFKRKLIDNETYLKQVVIYIHNNPVHHGFCNHPVEYAWSSYLTCISLKPTKIKRPDVLDWFGSKTQFETDHKEAGNRVNEVESFLNL